jgi:hypothetical protein
LIESIYIDAADTSDRASRYTLLLEKLHAAESAKNLHVSMTARVLKLHEQRIADARAAFEAEGARLRGLIKRVKA